MKIFFFWVIAIKIQIQNQGVEPTRTLKMNYCSSQASGQYAAPRDKAWAHLKSFHIFMSDSVSEFFLQPFLLLLLFTMTHADTPTFRQVSYTFTKRTRTNLSAVVYKQYGMCSSKYIYALRGGAMGLCRDGPCSVFFYTFTDYNGDEGDDNI